MKTFFKYLLTIALSAFATFFLINQYAPLLISVPEKDMELIDFDFDQTVNQKKIASVSSKAKNILGAIATKDIFSNTLLNKNSFKLK